MAGGRIVVNNPDGLQWKVNMTDHADATVVAYSDSTLETQVTFPNTISDTTTYYLGTDGLVTVSVKEFGGYEIAGTPDATRTIELKDGATFIFTPSADKDHDVIQYWDDLVVPLLASKLGGSKDPGFAVFKDDGAGSQGVFAYGFDAGIEEETYFSVQLTHAWVEGSDIYPHVHWSPGSSTNTGTVRWGLEYTVANPVNAPGRVFGDTTTIYVDDAAEGEAYRHQIAAFDPIDMTGYRASVVLLCRLFRDATNVADTFTADAVALSVDFHIQQVGRGGSYDQYPS